MDKKLIEKIEKCTTEKQVRRVLAENKIRIVRDNTWEYPEKPRFDVWIDELTRIYHPYKRAGKPAYMKVQKWQRGGKMTYSGAPMFSARDSYF